ncbi:MAG: hypothetical protein VB141_11925 [Burkholderia gladioli]
MVEITVFCLPKVVEAILEKMADRSPLMGQTHPYHGMTRDQLEPVLWRKIEKELKEHCSKPQTGALLHQAFVVGAPLDDTVFMCVGARPHPDVPQRTFTVEHTPIGGTEYMVDFYTLLNPKD